LREYGSPVEVGQAILNGDPEIDFEKAGMFINGTKKVYIDENDNPMCELILYDKTPGGAGFVKNLLKEEIFKETLRNAYKIVKECTCKKSCYSCLRNYYNQPLHDALDRHEAISFFEGIGVR
ncbi:MAG: DUF1998 domain-containing protein, partial [Methanosarcinaceae archaeon]|nr:DUF1998 domain-containing protein [Methanosarcinaceae archaeon]